MSKSLEKLWSGFRINRAAANAEYQQLGKELDDISSKTNFNGVKLLDGSFTKDFQVGANACDKLTVNLGTASDSAT